MNIVFYLVITGFLFLIWRRLGDLLVALGD